MTGIITIFVLVLFSVTTSHVHANSQDLEFSTYQGTQRDNTIKDICCGAGKNWIKPRKKGFVVVSTNSAPLWIKFGPLSQPGVIAFSSVVDVVKLYKTNENNEPVLVGISGDSVLTSKRQIISSTIAFPISKLELGKILYFRIEQENQASFMLDFMDRDTFDAGDNRANLVRMGLFGAVIMIALFNVAVSFVSRQPTFFFNACATLSLLGLNLYMTGIGTAYIWSNSPHISNLVLPISISSAIVFGALFAISFLHQSGSDDVPKSIWLIPAGFAAIILITGIGLPARLWMLTILALTFVLLGGFAVSMTFLAIKGNRYARIFLVPLSLAVLPGLIFYTANRTLGLQLGEYAKYLLEVTLCAEALFFSLALSTRLRIAEEMRLQSIKEVVNLQKTAGRLMIRAVDRDRRRIASDLHDTAGQSMMMISNQLAALKRDFELKGLLNQRLEKISEFSRETISDIRRISHELHPAVIDHLGWRAAIENLFDGLSTAKKIEIELEIEVENVSLDSTQQIHLYRIVQEITNNIARHSQAKTCQARIRNISGNVLVKICDDGHFSHDDDEGHEQTQSNMSLGRTIINYRVQALSGSWRIEQNENGLCVLISFPIEPKLDV